MSSFRVDVEKAGDQVQWKTSLTLSWCWQLM